MVEISQGNGHQRAAQNSGFRNADTQVRPLSHFTPSILLSHILHIRSSHIRVISDVIFPGQQGPQIIAADIGKPELVRSRASSIYLSRTKSLISLHHNSTTHAADTSPDPPSLTNAEVKATLRRLSKMVLAGYGGASLLFFGVSPSAFGARSSTPTSPPTSFSTAMAREKTMEEANLTNAVDASEAEAAGDSPGNEASVQEEYSWWDLLLGKHDQEIFERSTAHVDDSLKDRASSKERNKSNMKATAVSRLFLCPQRYRLNAFFFKGYWKGTSYASFLGPDRS